MGKKDSSGKNQNNNMGMLRSFAIIVKEIGLPGFIVVLLSFIFLTASSSDQKQEFIDRFILLKPAEYNLNCYFIVIALSMVLVLSSLYFRQILKLKKDEIKRLGAEKTILQEKLLLKIK